jgi:taurine dioxygenase
MRAEPISGALGAEILGIDIVRELDDATIAAIRQALLDHCVIFFRDQELDVARQKAFASRFGTLFLHPNIAGSAADPAVIDVVRNPGDRKIIGEDWHSDTPQVPARRWDRCSCRRRARIWRRHDVREPVPRL